MIEQKWGRIINCSSEGWKGGGIRQVNYNAASAGVLGLTFGVAKEVAEFGITCNAFAPSAFTRAIFELNAYDAAVPKEQSPRMGGMPKSIKKMAGKPMPGGEEFSPFICYLASDKAGDINCRFFTLSGSEIGLYPELEPSKHIVKYGGRWTVDELAAEVPRLLL
jgi:NAD(P)-dependent dehydrogenase (short-subunit alcohol dehydrogenase family)